MFDWVKKCREMKEENEGRQETMMESYSKFEKPPLKARSRGGGGVGGVAGSERQK